MKKAFVIRLLIASLILLMLGLSPALAQDDVIELRFMNWWDASREALMNEVIANFEAENPGIKVINEVQRPETGGVQKVIQPVAKPTAETAQTFLQELKSFWKEDSTRPSIEMSEVKLSRDFWDGLNKMSKDLDESVEEEDRKIALSTEAAAGVGISMTAGFVSWALRAGSMAASFLTAMPMWRNLDPMPILGEDNKKRQDGMSGEQDCDSPDDEERDGSVDALFER